jgi:hypothetical protein
LARREQELLLHALGLYADLETEVGNTTTARLLRELLGDIERSTMVIEECAA